MERQKKISFLYNMSMQASTTSGMHNKIPFSVEIKVENKDSTVSDVLSNRPFTTKCSVESSLILADEVRTGITLSPSNRNNTIWTETLELCY